MIIKSSDWDLYIMHTIVHKSYPDKTIRRIVFIIQLFLMHSLQK